jgi:cell division protein DivIC
MKWIKNRYLIITAAFVVWVVFFDQNSLINQWKLGKEIKLLEQNKSFYAQEVEKLRRENKELFGDVRNLEKFGRENFYMKKADEEIIIIQRDN